MQKKQRLTLTLLASLSKSMRFKRLMRKLAILPKIVPPSQCNLEQWIEWADKYAGLDSREQYAFNSCVMLRFGKMFFVMKCSTRLMKCAF